MQRVTTRRALAQAVATARAAGKRVAFVPTMGALHDGHLALCDHAAVVADFVVMSIFVNPLQFGPGEDFERYPRDVERDAALAMAHDVDVLFTPGVAEMYPGGATHVFVTADALEDRLCGAYRPGHFRGVLTVVAKLFHMVTPDVAIFGQKDLQQSVLIRRMVRDLDFPVAIEVAPIVREADGLAMSSRNVYLSDADRALAPWLHRALEAGRAAFVGGARSAEAVFDAARTALDAARTALDAARATLDAPRAVDASDVADDASASASIRLQYLELVDTETLEDVTTPATGNALAIAAYLGKTRLIDNIIL